MGELRQLIRLAADEAGGYRALARRSRGAVSASTLNNIVIGKHSGKLKDGQLSGVAMAIGRPARDVAGMVGRSYADPAQPFVMPERANALSRQQRKVVLSVVDAILTAAEPAVLVPDRPLRAVASGQRGESGAAQIEAASKAAKARQEHGS